MDGIKPAPKQTLQDRLSHLHPVCRRVLNRRGLSSPEHLDLSLNHLLPLGQLKGIQQASRVLAHAVESGQSIMVVGDYDADGATSTALCMRALGSMGAQDFSYLVPNRFEYGYGLTPEIVDLASQSSPDIIMTVDNGIASIDGVAAARKRGIQVLITDHHLPAQQLPDADVIVNPNQPGCDFPSKNLAGVGVAFYVMSALRAELRSGGWFERTRIPEPNMANLLDLVALGTVADVVPLDANNRILVEQGLRRIRAGKACAGIMALLMVARRHHQTLVSSDLGFAIGPRLNAAGRLDDMSHGIACLLEDNENQAQVLAAELDELNQTRRDIESSMRDEAEACVARLLLDQHCVPDAICLYEENWHQGVVGIVAGRIKEKFHRPVIAFAQGDDGILKGSARTIPGLHIKDILESTAQAHPGLITRFGGHAMAAGLSLESAKYQEFCEAFGHEVSKRVSSQILEPSVETDGILTESDCTIALAEQLKYIIPWGQQCPEPLFEGEFDVVRQHLVGQRHLKLQVREAAGNTVVSAICFNVDLALWPNLAVNRIKLIYRLDVNEFRGDVSLQFVVHSIQSLG